MMHRFAFRGFVAALWSALILATPISAVAGDDNLLTQFQGTWISDGNAFGQPAESRMVWTRALGDKFYKLDYSIHMNKGTDKEAGFEGVAYYKQSGNADWKAVWADNTGDLHNIKAGRDGEALVSIWGIKGEKLGRTRYELINTDIIIVTDWIDTENGWHQFNRNEFKKVVDNPAPAPGSE